MKPHFGQSDAAMNKLAGCNVLPNNNKPAELKGHFGHELGCDCAVCESMDLRVLYLERKAADLKEVKRLAYQAGFDAAMGTDFDPVKERDAAYDLGYKEGYNAAVYFAGGLISEQKPKELTSVLAELVWRLKL